MLKDTDKYGYLNTKRLSFEDTLDQDYEYRNCKMERDTYPIPYILDEERLINLVDNATRVDKNTLHKLNVIYDKTINKIKIWTGKEWESFVEENGITQIIRYIKSYFLNGYELYLIKKLHQDRQRGFNRLEVRDHLTIYYRFLIPFKLQPAILDYDDQEILGHQLVEKNDRYLADTYMTLYVGEKKKLKISEIRETKRNITKIIKSNSASNINELNNAIFDIIKADEGFRRTVMKHIEISG